MDPAEFPSAVVAFEYIQPSYSMMLAQYHQAHARLQQLGTVVPSVVLAGVAFVSQSSATPAFRSEWLIVGLLLAALSTAIAWGARFAWSTFLMPDPLKLYENHMRLDPAEFRAWAVGWAGDDFQANTHATRRLFNAALYSSLLFGFSVALLVVWAAQQV